MAENRSGAILAADFGSVHTRLVLLDTVDGGYRLVARAVGRSTSEFPFDDISVGLTRAIEDMSHITGRTLLDAGQRIITPERSDRAGVDYFVATASAGRPLRAVVVGLVPEISLASGLRAAAGSYVEISETLSLDDTRGEEDQVNAIIQSLPDLVLITGGTEGGAREPLLALAARVQMALQLLDPSRRPVILYAGNSQSAPQIQALFGGLAPVFVANNVRPELDKETLESAQLQLGRAFDKFKENRGMGFDTVSEMSAVGVLPTAQSYNLVVEYLGKGQGVNALVVDVGSAVSTLSSSLNRQVDTVIRTDIGLGHSAYTLLETAGVEAVRRWLPFNVSYEEVAAYARNKTMRPATIPQTLRDLYLEHALLRVGIQTLAQVVRPAWNRVNPALAAELPAFDPIIGAGAGLADTGSPGYSAMLLLDALQPRGVTALKTDPHALLPALGALAYFKPEAVVQALEYGGLEELGTSFSLDGQPRADRPAMRIRIKAANGQVTTHTVNGGHLWIYPLPPSEQVEVDVRAVGRGVSIGGRGRVRLTVTGGSAGVIFDARGRSLPLAKDARGRAAQMPAWLAAASGNALMEIDERWLEPVAEDTPRGSKPQAENGRRARRWRRGRQREETPEPGFKQLTPDEQDDLDEVDELQNALR